MEPTRLVFGRLSFFGAGPSTAHIGGGHNSVTAVESVSYHRDEIQSGVWDLPDEMVWAWSTGLMVTYQPHTARARTVCQRWPRPVWWRQFPRPLAQCRAPRQETHLGLHPSRDLLEQWLNRWPAPKSALGRYRRRRRRPDFLVQARNGLQLSLGSSHQSQISGWPQRSRTSPRCRRARGRWLRGCGCNGGRDCAAVL